MKLGNITAIAEGLRSLLESSSEQWKVMQEARFKPYLFDSFTLQKLIKSHVEQLNYLQLYENQFNVWREQNLSHKQLDYILDLQAMLGQVRQLHNDILNLADILKDHTIDSITSQDGFKLKLDFVDQVQH